jgi:type I restriction enzyme, S subunit
MSEETGWRTARLGEICEINPPKPKLTGVDESTAVLFVPMAAVDESSGAVASPEQSTVGAVGRKSYRSFTSGDVLFAKITPCMENGKAAIVPEIPTGYGFGSTEFHVLRPQDGIDARLVWHFVRQKSFRDEAAKHFTGTVGQLRVPPDFLREAEFLLPESPADQAKLADLLDAATQLSGTANERLAYSRQAIERFRRAVIAAACSGRLTSDWRDQYEDTSHDLAQRLRSSATKQRGPKPQPQPGLMDECPSSWEMITLSIAIDHIEAGRSFGTLGRAATDDEWGIIKVSAMSWGNFLPDENKAIDANQANPQYEIHSGDLLLSRANTRELVGATVLVGETRSRLLLSDKSLRLIPREGIVKPWLNYVLRSSLVRDQFSDQATGTSDSMRNLSQSKILATTIPLPPTAEQLEIAERVDGLLSLAGSVQEHIDATSRAVGRSSKAVLAKAFRGELAPADGVA